jgi:membrane associated rhomboid family serine protease
LDSRDPANSPRGDFVDGSGPIVLDETGIRLTTRAGRGMLIPYERVTHVASSPRGLAIGTIDDALLLRSRQFAVDAGPAQAERALKERLAALPGGLLQLSRMAEIDHRARSPRSRLAVGGFVALCVLAAGVQSSDPFLERAGSFIPSMVAEGEAWRLLTANFIHDGLFFPLHLGFNLLCILVLGLMVERALGALRTVVVMGVSGFAAMLACAWAGYAEVIGASGVAAGLAGALLALELQCSRRLPVWWRIPRRLFIAALLAQAVLDFTLPFVAAAAHFGGFVAGFAAAFVLARQALSGAPAGPLSWGGAAGIVTAVCLSLLALEPLLDRDREALERHALRLLHSAEGSISHDNDVAWMMVTETSPSELGIQAAAALAERAVERTGRSNPDLLDTLAEVLFVAGDIHGAIEIIDEAIVISEGEVYFWEQRRRFTGERSADDRPAPPILPWGLRGLEPIPEKNEWLAPGDPGLTI